MKITNVKVVECRSDIPVKGWDGLTELLNRYARGDFRGSNGTTAKAARDIGESYGGFAASMFLYTGATYGNGHELVKNLIDNAKEALQTRNSYKKSYDYDASGTSFFKTSVEIYWLDKEAELFAVHFNAAYVGDEPEEQLAEVLGVTRVLQSVAVNIQAEPISDKQFEFDFEPVRRALDKVLDTSDITGCQIAEAMMAMEYHESNPVFNFREVDGLGICLRPWGVDRMAWDLVLREQVDTWQIKGSKLRGNLCCDQKGEGENPHCRIVITTAHDGDVYDAPPIWQVEKQQAAIALASKIEAALGYK